MPLGALFMICPPLYPGSGGWKGSCLFGTRFGLQTQKVVAFVSWVLLGDPGLSNSHMCVPGVFLPILLGPPSEEKYSSTTCDQKKEIQDLDTKIMSWGMGHLQSPGIWADSFSLCSQQSGVNPERSACTFQSKYQI